MYNGINIIIKSLFIVFYLMFIQPIPQVSNTKSRGASCDSKGIELEVSGQEGGDRHEEEEEEFYYGRRSADES